jgi:excisionase family DNA binding protein
LFNDSTFLLTLDGLGIINNTNKYNTSRHEFDPDERSQEFIMPQIMTTKELAKYLKLHEITICKYAAEGKIPAIRIGRVWRFDKEAIDKWISGGQKK